MKKLLLILLLITNTVFAQNTNKIKTDTLRQVSIRADLKTPVSEKVVTEKDITKTYQGEEMVFILAKTPSFTFESDNGTNNGYVSLRLRGIDQTRLNVTLSDFPLSEPEDQGLYFSNFPDFALNISSLQIQRGVSVSSNGVSSFAGSINFLPNNGLDTGGSVQLGYGSFNSTHFNISNSTGLMSNHFALFTSLSSYYSSGYKYNSSVKGYSGFVSGGYYGNSNIFTFAVTSNKSLIQQAWLAVSEADIDKQPKTNYNDAGEDDNFTETLAQLHYTKVFNKDSYLTVGYQYIHLKGRWSMYEDESNPTPASLIQYGLHSDYDGLTTNYHFNTEKLKFDIGLSGDLYDRKHSGSIDSGLLYKNTGYKNEFSSYAKLSYDISKFTLYGDVQERYVDFRYVGDATIPILTWNFINPKGGITYNDNENVNYYASVGESHREPTRTDLFQGNDNLVLPFTNIPPERVIDYELGTNIHYSNFKAQGDLYYMDFHDEITLLGALGSNGLPLMTSVSKSYRSGLELDLNYKIDKHFSLSNESNFSRNYFTGTGGKFQPLYTPTVILNQGIQFSNNNFTIGLVARYQDESYISLDNKYTTPNFIIFNANINYKINKFTILLQGDNLTNKRYYTNGYVISDEKYYFVNAPLSGYVTVKYNW